MKRFMFIALSVAVLGVGVGRAAGGPNKGAATHYTASYDDTVLGLGHVECIGVRVENRNLVRDNFSCTISNTSFSARFTQEIPYPCGCVGWFSDFDGQFSLDYEIVISDGIVTAWANY